MRFCMANFTILINYFLKKNSTLGFLEINSTSSMLELSFTFPVKVVDELICMVN